MNEEQLTESLKNWKPQIMTHQHHFQVQISERVMVRWCVSCGKAWKCEWLGEQRLFFGDYWEEILERDTSEK